jgi:serine phosphatase RsbU (regulator of sigma subunit)
MLSSQNDLKHALKLLQMGAYDYVLKGDEDMEKIRLILSRIHAEEELKQAQKVIEKQNKILQYQHGRIQDSIKAGLRIQQIILPTQAKCEALLQEHFILYKPKDIVSGDFYWVEEIAGKRVVACIDCTGHGVSGAFMTLIAYQLLEKLLVEQGMQNPAEILKALDVETRKALKQDDTRLDMGMDMALLVIDKSVGENVQLTFAGAKSHLYFLTPHSSVVETIESTRNSIGSIFQTKEAFVNQSISLPTGSVVYMCSDGFCHQNNAQGNKIGRKRLFNLLLANRHQSLPIQKDMLWEAFEAHRENEVQRDDVLVMGMRV